MQLTLKSFFFASKYPKYMGKETKKCFLPVSDPTILLTEISYMVVFTIYVNSALIHIYAKQVWSGQIFVKCKC